MVNISLLERVKRMKNFIIFGIIIVNIFCSGVVLSDEQNNEQVYHLNQYPEIGQIFHWGMSQDQVETA